MVYYVPFIMSRVTFAWSRDVMIKTMSPSASPALLCWPNCRWSSPERLGTWDEGGLQAGREWGLCAFQLWNWPSVQWLQVFPLNPILHEDWHLWDKRHRIPLEVISLASLLPRPRPKGSSHSLMTSIKLPIPAQQFAAISPPYSSHQGKGAGWGWETQASGREGLLRAIWSSNERAAP